MRRAIMAVVPEPMKGSRTSCGTTGRGSWHRQVGAQPVVVRSGTMAERVDRSVPPRIRPPVASMRCLGGGDPAGGVDLGPVDDPGPRCAAARAGAVLGGAGPDAARDQRAGERRVVLHLGRLGGDRPHRARVAAGGRCDLGSEGGGREVAAHRDLFVLGADRDGHAAGLHGRLGDGLGIVEVARLLGQQEDVGVGLGRPVGRALGHGVGPVPDDVAAEPPPVGAQREGEQPRCAHEVLGAWPRVVAARAGSGCGSVARRAGPMVGRRWRGWRRRCLRPPATPCRRLGGTRRTAWKTSTRRATHSSGVASMPICSSSITAPQVQPRMVWRALAIAIWPSLPGETLPVVPTWATALAVT